MSPTFNGSSVIQRFEHTNAIEISDGVMFKIVVLQDRILLLKWKVKVYLYAFLAKDQSFKGRRGIKTLCYRYECSLKTLFLESSNLPLGAHYPIRTYAHININLPSPPLQGTQGEEGEESKPSSSQQKDADPETADATSTGIIDIYCLKRA